jgi:hypothetical protein
MLPDLDELRPTDPLAAAIYRVAVLEIDHLLRTGAYRDGRELELEDLERLRLMRETIAAELGLA